MQITQLPATGRTHLPIITDLLYQHGHHHQVDLPYRLASWSLDYPENVALWQDQQTGRLLACAIIQEPFLTLDYAIHPDARPHNLQSQIFQWAVERGPAIAARQQRTFPIYVWMNGHQDENIPLLESLGFIKDHWQKITYTLPLDAPRSSLLTLPSSLPPGFTLRPLNGRAEVEAYVELHRAAFDSRNMTVEWRQRTLEMPQYVPDIDLVIEAPDGRLAAFCICWLNPDHQVGEIEPLGVHPHYHRLGLGRAIALEALHRLQAHGATTAQLMTDGERDPARQLYEAVGFTRQNLLLGYGRLFRP